MIDRSWCVSSYLAFRYVWRDDVDFSEGVGHRRVERLSEEELVPVRTWRDADAQIRRELDALRDRRLGLLLSGGMDSACLATYMPEGSDAYTFRFAGGDYQAEELARAERFAETCSLELHYVDITWDSMLLYVGAAMRSKGAPVHSIEPQLVQAATQAKGDGVECMVYGDAADYVFGGMDRILSRDWEVAEFARWYTYIEPASVLREPADVSGLYERYRIPGTDRLDLLGFYDGPVTDESYLSYQSAFAAAGMSAVDPYERMRLAAPLDLALIRSGESKYIVRDLFRARYEGIPLPEKNPMPRPVDAYFAGWEGPKRPEFRNDIDMGALTGNQRWQLWCLERFLNLIDAK